MTKLIGFVGYSRTAGVLKFRTASDEKRAEQLAKLGDTDINMTALPMEMTKASAAKWALTAAFFAKCDQAVFALFTANVKDENPFVAKAAKPARAAKPVAKAATVTVTVAASDLPKMTAEERKHIERYWNNNHIAPAMKRAAAEAVEE